MLKLDLVRDRQESIGKGFGCPITPDTSSISY